jgi:hypothetical protein
VQPAAFVAGCTVSGSAEHDECIAAGTLAHFQK